MFNDTTILKIISDALLLYPDLGRALLEYRQWRNSFPSLFQTAPGFPQCSSRPTFPIQIKHFPVGLLLASWHYTLLLKYVSPFTESTIIDHSRVY